MTNRLEIIHKKTNEWISKNYHLKESDLKEVLKEIGWATDIPLSMSEPNLFLLALTMSLIKEKLDNLKI